MLTELTRYPENAEPAIVLISAGIEALLWSERHAILLLDTNNDDSESRRGLVHFLYYAKTTILGICKMLLYWSSEKIVRRQGPIFPAD